MKKCAHCKGNIEIRNPKGFCDHLYYPDACAICSVKIKPRNLAPHEIDEMADTLEVTSRFLSQTDDFKTSGFLKRAVRFSRKVLKKYWRTKSQHV